MTTTRVDSIDSIMLWGPREALQPRDLSGGGGVRGERGEWSEVHMGFAFLY